MAGGNPELHQPLIVQLNRRYQTCVGKRVNRIEQRMAEDVVVRRQLRLDPRHGDEAAYPQIHALRNVRGVDIDIFQGRIKAVLTMIVQQLAAQVALRDREAIVRAVEGGKVVAPVDMIALCGIGQPLGVKNNLVYLKTIRVDIVRFGRIAVGGGAEVQRRIDPPI